MAKGTNRSKKTLVHVVCKGVTPILHNRMSDEQLDDLLGKQSKASLPTDITPEEIAAMKIHEADGVPGITLDMLLAALNHASRFVKYKGKMNVANKDASLLPSFIMIEGEFFPFPEDCREWVVDKRRGMNKNRDALCLIRPRFPKWGFEFDMEVDNTEVETKLIREVVDKAGKFSGLGSHRSKGGFGRFKVVEWKETPIS